MPDRSPPPTARLLAFALFVVLAYLAVSLYVHSGELGFPLDDPWIHLQFARNLAHGDGLSYNAGELVAGSTAPLWTGLVSILFLLPGGQPLLLQLLGIAFHLTAVHATAVFGREMGLGRAGATLAAALTAATSWLAWSALSGLEIPLFVTLSLWGMILHLRERSAPAAPPRSLLVLAVAALARPEGLALLLAAVADRSWVPEPDGEGLRLRRPRWRQLAIGVALAVVVLAPLLLFQAAVGGSPLPTTFHAKTGGAHRGLPMLGHLWVMGGILFRAHPLLVFAAAAGVLALVVRWPSPQGRGLLPALWLVGLPVAISLLSPGGGAPLVGNFGRYLFPLFPVLVVVGLLGLEGAGRTLGSALRIGPLRLPLRAALIAGLLLAPTLVDLARGAGRFAQSVGNVIDSDVRVARWLASRLPAGAVLAVNDVGAIKYLLPEVRIVDLAGIVNPEAVRYRRQAVARGEPASEGNLRFLARHRPDYLVVFPSWFPGLAREGSGFVPRLVIDVPDNITMGGDRIAVLSTPWTRLPLADAAP